MDAIVAVVVVEVELDRLKRDVAVEDVVETIVVAKVAVVVVDEDDVGDVVVEVVLVDVVVVLAVDVDTGIGSVAADLDASVGASTGDGTGCFTGAGGGKAVRTGGRTGVFVRVAVEIVKVDVVFKEDVVDVGVVFFDVAEFCLFEFNFFTKKICVVFSSTTEMRRFDVSQKDGEKFFCLFLLTA